MAHRDADFLQSATQIAEQYKKDFEKAHGGALIEDIMQKISQFKEYFVVADTDDSLDIDFGELKSAMERFKIALTEDELLYYLALVDDDNTRTLRFREFLNFMFLVTKVIKAPVPETAKKQPAIPLRLRRPGARKQKKRGSLHVQLAFNEGAPGSRLFSVTIKEARDLLAMDLIGTSDPYVKVVLTPGIPGSKAPLKYKTKVIKKNLSPCWNEVFSWSFPTSVDLKAYTVLITLWDWDFLSSNDFMGAMAFSLGDVIDKPVDGWYLLLDRNQGLRYHFEDLSSAQLAQLAPSNESAVRPKTAAAAMPQTAKQAINEYELLKVLGRGAYGKVFLAQHKASKKHVALKSIKKTLFLEDEESDLKNIWMERSVLALVPPSPFVSHMYAAFQSEACLYFALELHAGGDLMTLALRQGKMPAEHAAFYIAETVLGLEFLHANGVIHRDIKLDNLMLDADGHVKVGDFGLCRTGVGLGQRSDSYCGTPTTMAPEVYNRTAYSFEVDWWSLGVVTFELMTALTLFSGDTEDDIRKLVLYTPISIGPELGVPAQELLQGLLCRDPTRRLGSPTAGGVAALKQKRFFVHDWAAIAGRTVAPPYVPAVKDPSKAAANFDSDFTSQPVVNSPPLKSELKRIKQEEFLNFTFVAPTLVQDFQNLAI
eukprot:m.232773 g.232773  ORF g.232773 m.232773 type:complete len:654 (-) comp12410_c0_seq1:111-2072(-)